MKIDIKCENCGKVVEVVVVSEEVLDWMWDRVVCVDCSVSEEEWKMSDEYGKSVYGKKGGE